MTKLVCYACGKRVGQNPRLAITEDGQPQYVGSECYKMLGDSGWQPPLGGPKLFRGVFNNRRVVIDVVGLPNWAELAEIRVWNDAQG